MAKEKTIELAQARRWADKIAAELAPFCEKIEIAGSIRRRRPEVHDIDLVILTDKQAAVNARLSRNAVDAEACGPRHTMVRLANGVLVDAYFAGYHQQDFFRDDPCSTNWGSVLLCRTGPKEYNVRLAQRARARGMRWVLGAGIYSEGRLVASDTEQDIYRVLALPYARPEDRV